MPDGAIAGPGGSHRSSTAGAPNESTADAPSVYDSKAVTQTFIKTPSGGVERIVAIESGDAKQIGLIRTTLQRLADDFGSRNFSSAGNGQRTDLAGVATLVEAPPGALRAEYFELRGGGEIRLTSIDPRIVSAVHDWFDAEQALPASGATPAQGR